MEAFGIENLHLKRESLHGSSFCGFEGCVRYKPSGERQYTQKQATKLASRLPAADVLLCHCPPYGVNDDPDDPAHIGFHALREWVDRHQPKVILHGHTHPMPGHAAQAPRRHARDLRQGREGHRPSAVRRSRTRRGSPSTTSAQESSTSESTISSGTEPSIVTVFQWRLLRW